MKNLSLNLLFSLFALPLCLNAAEAVKNEARKAVVGSVAVFNIQDVMPIDMETLKGGALEWQDEIKKLQSDLQKRAEKIQEKSKRLEELANEMKKKSKVSSESSQEESKEEMGRLQTEIQQAAQSLQAYQEKQFGKIRTSYYAKVEKALDEVFVMQGWDIITPVAMKVSKRCDVTDDVRKILDAEYKASKTKKETAKDKTTPVASI